MKISLITACYNSEATIGTAIESVLSQKGVDVEYIVVDGGSKDGTVEIIKEYAEKIESFEILAGYLDGAVVAKDTVVALADIPSKEVLIAKFLGSIKSPLYGFAYALQAVIDKNGEAAPAADAEA